jgi:hypothetical protein
MALTDKLSNIAEAIRSKTGKNEEMTLDEMPNEIESISGGGAANAVTYTEQTLTEAQKTQARTNIGAASPEEVLLALLPNAMGVAF